jgi:hypothetical protein
MILITMRPDWTELGDRYRHLSVENAIAAVQEQGRYPGNITALAIAYVDSGNLIEATKLIKEMEALYEQSHEGTVALGLVGLYYRLDNKNATLTWFERALENRAPGLCDISRCTYYKSLQKEPRYQAVLDKVGFR